MADVPDVYTDQVTMAQSPYGITFTFSLSPSTPSPVPGQNQAEPQVVLRMSLEHAKVLAMLIRRNLKQYELEHLADPIRIPAAVLQQMRLSEQDW